MKKIIFLLPILSSCEFLITHPAEDAILIEAAEGVVNEVYQYETGHPLIPAPIPQQEVKSAPFKIEE